MMLATINSLGPEPIKRTWFGGEKSSFRRTIGSGRCCGIILITFLGGGLFAQTTPTAPNTRGNEINSTRRARQLFIQARKQFQADTNNAEAAWHFARACFDLAEFATEDTERAELAEQGIAVSRQLTARRPKLAAAHYYLGMNLGQLARTKTLGALRIVDEMEREFKTAGELDEHFDYAGPDRNLGLLYLEAPSIGSIGSRTKARHHLRRAAELAPDYPENRLNLIEALLRWSDRASARRELQALETLWPRARAALAGDDWTKSWKEWEQRLNSTRKKLQEPSRVLEAPHHSQ